MMPFMVSLMTTIYSLHIILARFASEAAYRAHQNSSHVQGLYLEYIQYITQPFVFYPIDTADRVEGGFERCQL